MPDIGAAVGAGGSLLGGILGSKGSKDAAKTQADAARYAADMQWKMYDQTRGDLSPWRVGGGGAAYKLYDLLGIPGGGYPPSTTAPRAGVGQPSARSAGTPRSPVGGGDPRTQFSGGGLVPQFTGNGQVMPTATDPMAQQPPYQTGPQTGSLLDPVNINLQNLDATIGYENRDPNIGYDESFTLNEFMADPSYQFRLAEGEKALNRAGAARGMYDSGALVKELMGHNSDLASQEFGNAYGRWAGDRQFKYGAAADDYNRFAADRLFRYGAASDDYNRRLGKRTLRYNSNVANKDRIYNYLMGISNQGLNAATQTGAAGMNAANSAGNTMTSGAAATAAGQVGSANAWSGAIGDILNSYQEREMWNKILAGGAT